MRKAGEKYMWLFLHMSTLRNTGDCMKFLEKQEI